MQEGWALKTAKPQKRFSVGVKQYLLTLYETCNSTGRRPNFEHLSSELKVLRNTDGSKKFSQEEWLSPSQIRSLFAGFIRLGDKSHGNVSVVKVEEIKDAELQSVLEEIESAEIQAAALELTDDIINNFE